MILVIFGSKSDKAVYDRVVAKLEELGVAFTLRIASAHKSPELVEEIIKEKFDCIIAGAGLAAHLPGVIAAKVTCPVIGVPCKGAFEGLDALLSIVQMPPGIPVLSVGIEEAEEAARNAKLVLDSYSTVNIVQGDGMEKAQATLEKLGVPYKVTADFDSDCININFSEPKQSEALVINVPQKDDAHEFIKFKHGLYVGKGRGDNAAVAAAEIMKINLDNYRKELEKKIIDADEEERK
ncbi:AIR carboxylase family protein [Nanoarchaeota archaeon]